MFSWKKRLVFSFLFICVFLGTLAIGNAIKDQPAIAVSDQDWERFLEQQNFVEAVSAIEQHWERDYENYFGANLANVTEDAGEIAEELSEIENKTGTRAAVMWVWARQDQLQLVLITPGEKPIGRSVQAANRDSLLQTARELRSEITNPRKRNSESYLQPAQQIYDWMIAPLESQLEAERIDTLLLCLGAGLRTLPMAALHDGERFLAEKYALARIPAYNLTDTDYQGLKTSEVLAMGASEFEEQNPLPAVPMELSAIATRLWKGQKFINEEFTIENLQSQQRKHEFEIIHLATHAEFVPGEPSKSYIQFWGNERLGLDEIGKLKLDRPQVELLVLSACETAVGDKQVELGFAGLAVQAGVKSALASLWYVSDTGTLALMTEFYRHLQSADTKAEALQQAQMAMLKGQVRLQGGELRGSRGAMELPPQLAELGDESLSHPYYWAAFSLIGSPW